MKLQFPDLAILAAYLIAMVVIGWVLRKKARKNKVNYLLGGKSPLARLRGRIHEARGVKLIVTYHPAYLLRDPSQKKEAWKDLQMAMAELGLKVARAQG